MRHIRWPSLENLFVLIAVVGGLLFALLVPPNQVPDEHLHVARAYGLLRGNVASQLAFLPAELPGLLAKYYRADAQATTVDFPISAAQVSVRSSEWADRPDYAMQYSPILYVPQSLGVSIGMLLKLPDILILLLGRLVSLLAYVGIGYSLLRRTPWGKTSMFLTLTLPMSIFLAASFSADALNNCISFAYLIVVMLAFSSEGEISRRERIIFSVGAVLLGLSKPLSWLLTLTLVGIPAGRFADGRRRITFVLGQICVSLIFTLLWQAAVSVDPLPQPNPAAEPMRQLLFMVLNPFSFGMALLSTIPPNWEYWLRSAIGLFGWLTVYMPDFVYGLAIVAVGAAVIADAGKSRYLNNHQRLVFLGVAILYVLAVETAAYVVGAPVGGSFVIIQGRYLIPIVPLLLLVVASLFGPRVAPLANGARAMAAAIVPVVLLFAVQTIYLRYYAPCGDFMYDVSGLCVLPTTAEVAHQPAGELVEPMTQSFTAECSGINGIYILLSTFGRDNTGSVEVSLRQVSSGQVMVEEKLDVQGLEDNTWVPLRFPSIPNGTGDRLALTLAPQGAAAGNAITAWVTTSEQYTQGQPQGVHSEGNLEFRYTCPYGVVGEFLGKSP